MFVRDVLFRYPTKLYWNFVVDACFIYLAKVRERQYDCPNAAEVLASIASLFGAAVPDLRVILPTSRTTEPPVFSSFSSRASTHSGRMAATAIRRDPDSLEEIWG